MTAELMKEVQQEIENARTALAAGNDGKARVCCRRAAGKVIADRIPIAGSKSSVALLRHLASDLDIPEEIRGAAGRLITNVNRRLSANFTLNPILDLMKIINYLAPGSILP